LTRSHPESNPGEFGGVRNVAGTLRVLQQPLAEDADVASDSADGIWKMPATLARMISQSASTNEDEMKWLR
jgi:hypothetical protein